MQQFIELAYAYKVAPMGSPQSQAALLALCNCVEWLVHQAAQHGLGGLTNEKFQLLEGVRTMLKPTIGMPALYHPRKSEQIHVGDSQAAIICFTSGGGDTVSLAVFDAHGRQYPVEHVELWQGGTQRPKENYCELLNPQTGQLESDARMGSTQDAQRGVPQNNGPRAA